jgi:GAF domain-containing protein
VSSTAVGERGDLSRWFEALRRLNHVIDNAGEIERFAAALNEYLCETFEAQAASLILVDPRTDELIFRTAGGAPVTLLNQARLHRGEGIAGWVCQHHESLNIADARHDPRFCSRVDATTGFYTRSVMCVSLYRAGQIEGAIEVLNPVDGGVFDDDRLAFLEIVAEQVELLIANSALIEGLRRRNSELTTLIDIDRAVNAVHDLDRLLQTILRSATEVAQAAGASVVLRDSETGELRFFHCVGPTQAELVDVRIEPGQGVVGHCIDQGESIFVPDAYRDSRFFRDIDTQTGFRTTSLLAVPLITSTGVIGALEVVRQSGRGGAGASATQPPAGTAGQPGR